MLCTGIVTVISLILDEQVVVVSACYDALTRVLLLTVVYLVTRLLVPVCPALDCFEDPRSEVPFWVISLLLINFASFAALNI